MGFSDYDDDVEYEDDDDYYEYEDDDYIDLDDEDDDDDESTFGKSGASGNIRSNIKPFGSPPSGASSRPTSPFSSGSSSTGSSRFGSTYTSGSRQDPRDKGSDDKSSSTSSFRPGGSSAFGGSSSSAGNRPTSPFNRTSSTGGSSTGGSSSSSTGSRPSSPFTRGSDSDSSSSSSTSRLPGSKPFGSSGDSSSSSSRPSSPFSRGGSSTTSSSSSSSTSGSSTSGSSTSASRPSSPFSRSGSDNKDDDKSSSGSRLGGFGRSNKDDSKDDKSGGSRLGGLFNRGAGKDDQSRSSTSSDKSGGSRLGGMFNRGSKDDSGASSRGASGSSASSSPFGSRSSTPTSSTSSSAAATTTSGARPSPFGRNRGNETSTTSTRTRQQSDGGGGGVFGRLFGRGDSQSRPQRPQRGSRVPQTTESEGLTLDNWLDILGVGLVFGSFVLFFTALSNEQAAISGILEFISDMFAWGALAVPVIMFLIGMWLIIRHFGDQAPTIDPIRISGAILGFITLLIFFQWIDSFSYQTIPGLDSQQSLQILSARLEQAWNTDHTGGGFIGAGLYYQLVVNVGEIGAFFLVAFAFIISGMLATRLTASEMLAFFVSLWRSMRDYTRNQAVQQRAKKLQREQQRALEAQKPNITVSDLAQPVLDAGATAGALPSGEEGGNFGSDIRFNLGGRTQAGENVPIGQPNRGNAPPPSGGLFSRFRRNQPTAPNSSNGNTSTNGDVAGSVAGAVAGGLAAGLFSGRSDEDGNDSATIGPMAVPQATPQSTTQQPLPGLQSNPAQATMQPAAGLSQFSAPQTGLPQTSSQPMATPATTNPFSTPPSNGGASQLPENPFASLSNGGTQATMPPANPTAQTGMPEPQKPASRADRLNEIRMGPNSLSPVIPTQGDVDDAVPQGYNTYGRPSDIPTHRTEKLPFQGMQSGQPSQTTPPSRLPSAQTSANEAMNPHQQRLSVQPNRPMSSPVRNQSRPKVDWRLPDYRTLLSSGSEQEFDRELLLRQARIIEDTLESFGAPGRVVEVNTGPVITQFGVEPDYISSRGGKRQRVKVGAIAALDRDLQLALGARSIRVEAPVPGKGYVGVEVPNEESSLVSLRDVMESDNFQKSVKNKPLTIALGQSVSGAPVSADLSGMPHLLIAGATGSGKSVCVNSIIASLLAFNQPDTVKFIMVDPKRVELTGYNGIPHLVAPVVTDVERIIGVLKWVTREMDDRYKQFSDSGSRNITDYNKHRDPATTEKMPYIIVIIDELADLMMIAPDETERTITRIAALARATGIHLVIATQRPSVDVVTGLIKANFPARIAFAVSDGTNSRVILDQPGAERLLGRGDMLYMSGNSPAPVRMQGVFVSDMEIDNIVRYWKMQALEHPDSVQNITNLGISAKPDVPTHDVRPRGDRVRQQAFWDAANADSDDDEDETYSMPYRDATIGFNLPDNFGDDVDLDENAITGDTDEDDELYEQAVELVRRLNKASVSLLQRRLRIGYTRSARLIDVMEARGVIGPAKEGSSKPR
ncbi:MAG: DUF87 domain-containing protein, partial [Anaerolineae bacterium]|nr:DUF87 domain-containing protein [Anaerolineae bacterium]